MSHTSCFTHYAFLAILLFTIVLRCSSIGSRRWGGTARGTFSAAERTRAAVSAAREGGRLPPGSRSHRPRSQCGTSACWARWTRIRPPWSWCPSLAWVPGQMSQSHWSAAKTVSGQFKSDQVRSSQSRSVITALCPVLKDRSKHWVQAGAHPGEGGGLAPLRHTQNYIFSHSSVKSRHLHLRIMCSKDRGYMVAPSKPAARYLVSLRNVDISHAYWLLYTKIPARPPHTWVNIGCSTGCRS